ncbi:MAG: type II toxin-antitoxin system PemK/MazF family toxin [bacterium]|nr:type II toxin-antitoxin system PemK/MazF family toxin [bacterium]
MLKKIIRRGDIYYANLDEVKGSEQGGIRPVLIIQNNIGNYFSSTVIIAPISTKQAKLPTHVKIKPSNIIKKNSIVLLEQTRVIDKCRLKSFLGKLSLEEMQQIDNSINIALGIKGRSK